MSPGTVAIEFDTPKSLKTIGTVSPSSPGFWIMFEADKHESSNPVATPRSCSGLYELIHGRVRQLLLVC